MNGFMEFYEYLEKEGSITATALPNILLEMNLLKIITLPYLPEYRQSAGAFLHLAENSQTQAIILQGKMW